MQKYAWKWKEIGIQSHDFLDACRVNYALFIIVEKTFTLKKNKY